MSAAGPHDLGASGPARPRISPARIAAIRWAMLAGNFVIGSAILLPAGMLAELAEAFRIDVATAGALVLASGIVVAIGAPLLAGATSRIDRRLLLTSSLALYVAAHAASALATRFDLLIAARVAIGIGAAIFTPQAAATLGALLPVEERASAITFAFIGWSLASVGGVPMGGLIAHLLGWQAAFVVVALSAFAAAIATWLTVPRGVRIAPLGMSSWIAVATSPALMLVLLVSVLNGTGQFTHFTYLSPSLKASLGADAAMLTGVLVWFGAWATIGNFAASQIVARWGADRAVLVTLLSMAAGLALWGVGAHIAALVMLAAALWGVGNFATNSMQQARLAAIAPPLASASIALNTSAIYIGQGTGSALGGHLITAHKMWALPFAGSIVLVAAAAVSALASRMRRPPSPKSG